MARAKITKKATKKAAAKKTPAKRKAAAKKPAKAAKQAKEPKKAAAAKPKSVKEPKAKKEPKAAKPKTGRRRRPEQFTADMMNADEKKIIEAFQIENRPLTNAEITEKAFDNKGINGQKDIRLANSRTRNRLRRLRATGWLIPVKGIGEGLWAAHWMGYTAPPVAAQPTPAAVEVVEIEDATGDEPTVPETEETELESGMVETH